MESFFQPPPEVLAFLALKKAVYLPALAALSLLRGFGARGPSRLLALAALALALAGLGALAVPGMGLATDGGPYRAAWAAVNAVQGIALPLAASVPLALSALVPGWRWRLIDLAHALLIAALVILWAWAG